jgi:hypothetical protein
MKRSAFGKVFAGFLVGSFGVILYLGCGSPDKVGTTGGDGGNGGGSGGVTVNLTDLLGGTTGTGGDGGTLGASSTSGSAEGTCGDTTITPNRAPVDVLIVLDRSDSMGYSMTGDCYCSSYPASLRQGSVCNPEPANCGDRWTVVSAAVDQTISANPSLNWGLELFSAPSSPSCSVSLVPQVAVAATSGPQIQSLLATMTLQLWTPTALGVNAANLYLQGVKDGNDKVILLATDGEPNCKDGKAASDDDMPATSAAVAAAAAAGFPVYVVGIGPPQGVANLDQLAQVGGTGHYYPADSAQALADSLATISKIVSTTCEFQTPMSPPDATRVYVYLDKTLINHVAASTDDGWMFGATSSDIVLTGTFCSNLLDGAAATVQIIFGCKDYNPPINIP